MSTPESSKPSSKRSSDDQPDAVLADLKWMSDNGALRHQKTDAERQAELDAQAEADREDNLNDDYEWPDAS